jgi:hypothetical protein
MTEEDELIDKFIDGKGNVSEDDLAKLTGEQPTVEEPKDDDAERDNREPETESDEESRSDEERAKEDVAEDGEQESPPEPEPDTKRAKAESNQAKAIRVDREKRKQLERALRQQAEKSAKIEQLVSKLIEPVETKEVIPDADEDPIGHQNFKIKRLEQLQQQTQDNLRLQHEYQENQFQQQQFVSAYAQKAKEFSQEAPDFMDAYKHLIQSRIEEHLIAGYDEQTANELLKQEEAAIVSKAFQDGENPAARMYALAKRRGFSAPKPQPTTQPKTSKLQTLKQGISTNKSLGSSQGSANSDEVIDSTDIADMTDDEVDKIFKLYKAGKISFN